MKLPTLTKSASDARRSAMRRTMLSLMAGATLAGCISVKAPDKPIEINLNINVRQEVVVSLRDDVKDLAKQYPGVF